MVNYFKYYSQGIVVILVSNWHVDSKLLTDYKCACHTHGCISVVYFDQGWMLRTPNAGQNSLMLHVFVEINPRFSYSQLFMGWKRVFTWRNVICNVCVLINEI